MATYISPNFANEKLENPTIDDLIDVFEDRIEGWLLNPAKKLVESVQGQIPGFSLLLTYFEGIWSYKQGVDSKGKSKQFFIDAFVDVFQSSGLKVELLQRTAKLLYEDARCGFFHDGLFRERIFFAKIRGADLIITLPKKNGIIDEEGKIQSILIDAQSCYLAVVHHFSRFIKELRDPNGTVQRCGFEEFCKEKWNWEEEGKVIGIADPSGTTT